MNFNKNDNFIISFEMIIDIFSFALKRLVNEDIHLLNSGAQERSLQFKLACYLREYLLFTEYKGIFVDVEYNRDGKSQVKKSSNGNCFYPDIILHERGSADYTGNKKNRNNILYCEIKKDSMAGQKDEKKVIEQMKMRKYKFGIDLYSLNKDNIFLNIFIESNLSPIGYKFDKNKQKLVVTK